MDLEEVVDWYKSTRIASVPADRAMELYFQFHPRTSFLKTLPAGSILADVGAGDGSLSVFRDWPEPARRDLRMYAYSLEKGERFDAFDGFEIGDWNISPPKFDGISFDGIVSAHFIEHIADPTSFIEWAARKLAPGGRAYVEWPSPQSRTLPPRSELLGLGVDLVISRFDDDTTHRDLPDREAMAACAQGCGLVVSAAGTIRLPWLEDQLMANFREATDRFPVQAAFWSWTEWAQYLILVRPGP